MNESIQKCLEIGLKVEFKLNREREVECDLTHWNYGSVIANVSAIGSNSSDALVNAFNLFQERYK